MRYPVISWQKPVFDLIAYLNKKVPDFQTNLVPYHFSCPSGNRVYVNHTKQKDGSVMTVNYANDHPDELGFPPEADPTTKPLKLLQDAVIPVIEEMRNDFVSAEKK